MYVWFLMFIFTCEVCTSKRVQSCFSVLEWIMVQPDLSYAKKRGGESRPDIIRCVLGVPGKGEKRKKMGC